ncbi:hypothetical protein LAUMK4_03289 [Mycobacterium persicum]|uniref:Uncharacterized protein n=1 Tax=Mycobacterium persicum TaxID=1487726 RepID=A0ABY6RKD3_9MYCO|nr:hypothetical protein [Mycobacterium persicum]VAZ76978.1 hypothetical protein LAUMK15_03600 [Mycobacterium persicum]VAZ95850.1 hypothetical protein LAUMK4_03289 [Mycobacterium persicum]
MLVRTAAVAGLLPAGLGPARTLLVAQPADSAAAKSAAAKSAAADSAAADWPHTG